VLVAEDESPRPYVHPKRSLAGALQEDRDDLFFTIYIEIRVSIGRKLYRLVETRSYSYKHYGSDGMGGSESLPQPRKRRGQAAHASTIHPLTVGFIAELFALHLPSLGAAEKRG
jgi:hypothetical protein